MSDILHRLEEESRRRSQRLRELILEQGRPDVLAQYDADMKNLRLGITGARSTWHSISPAQRKVLVAMGQGGSLRRRPGSRTRYDAFGRDVVYNICGLATVRNLTARELCVVGGGAFDPEAKILITERGEFVLRHGPTGKA